MRGQIPGSGAVQVAKYGCFVFIFIFAWLILAAGVQCVRLLG